MCVYISPQVTCKWAIDNTHDHISLLRHQNTSTVCLHTTVPVFHFRLSDKGEPIQIAASINGSWKTNISGVLLPKHADRLILSVLFHLNMKL